MSDFTKDELETISYSLIKAGDGNSNLHKLAQSMIDNYCEARTSRIVKAHLQQASSLISHAMCLLGMDDE